MTAATYTIKALLEGGIATDSTVTIEGWLRTRRDSKAGLSFLQVNDGSCLASLQVVAGKDLDNYSDEVLHLSSGCALRCTGRLVESPGRGQRFEIQATSVELVGPVEHPDSYPIQPKRHSFEFLREVAHLRPRTNTFGAMTRVRHATALAIHDYFDRNGYYWISTPLITASDAEGAGQMFRVSTLDLANLPRTGGGAVDFSQDFFGRETFLTVSGQLNVEAYCQALTRVYTFGPTFRAENSNTPRHLAEFWMVEPELAFADLGDIVDLAENFLKHIFRRVLDHCAGDMAFFAERIEPAAVSRLENMIRQPFRRISYTEAVRILRESGHDFEYPPEWGADLQTEHERYLTEQHFKAPVVVTDYPAGIKAFYMRSNPEDPEVPGPTVAAMDVLAPGIGEIIGGSQREERLDMLQRRMREMGIDAEHYDWYLDLRRYGTVPHAGFGLGFERLVSYITGMANVRDVAPFPRVPGNARF